MKHKFFIEIDGVRHKLIETKVKNPCKECSAKEFCLIRDGKGCSVGKSVTHFRKCKPGE